MSFFDDFPRPKPPRFRSPPKHQPWHGHELGWIGGWVPWRIVLFKALDAFAELREFEAYPTGLHFSLVTAMRQEPVEPGDNPMQKMQRMMMFPEAGGPRFGVVFADGRKVAMGARESFPRGDKEPDRPVLIGQGGGGGGNVWHMGYWLWPLPPPGPLTWVASWDERAIPETSVVVDASVLADAAAEAEKLWDESEGDEGQSSSSASSTLMRSSATKKGAKGGGKKGKK